MKNKVLLSWVLIIFFTSTQLAAIAYSKGPPDGHNGQPPSNASCGLVALCHGADPIVNVGIEITIDGNPTTYTPGEVYNIEVFISDPFSDCFGFQIGAQFADEIKSAGEFIVNSTEVGLEVTETGNFQYVEHNEPSKSGKWNFLWTAPNGNALEDVVFYAAGVVADCNEEPVNDPTYTTSKKFASGCKEIVIAPVMQGNALIPRCDYSAPMPSIAIDFEPISGGSGSYTLVTEGSSRTDRSALYEGDSFTYFYTDSDIENNTIGLTVVDEAGHICKLADDLITLFSSIPVNAFCPEQTVCNNEIDVDIEPGEINELFNCVEGEDKISLLINSVLANDNVNGILKLYSLDGNNLIAIWPDLYEYEFEVYFSQAQIDALQVGFILELENGCETKLDLNDKIINTNISELCNLQEEEPCEKPIAYAIDGGVEAPVVKCNPLNITNPIYTINIKNVIGGDGSYSVKANGGALTKSSITEGDSFIYVLTTTTIEAENAIITIEDENGCSSILDFNASLANYDLNALCECTINYDVEKIENTNTPAVNCVDKENGIFSLTITNVTGLQGEFDFLTSLGSVEIIETFPVKFIINFTKADYDSGNLNFTIESNNCSITNNLPDLSMIDFDTLCGPIEPVCSLELTLNSKTDLACNQATGSIALTSNAVNNEAISYNWQHNSLPILIDGNEANELEAGTYTIIAEDTNGCISAPLIVVINETADELNLFVNEAFNCSLNRQFYDQRIRYDAAAGDLSITTSTGIVTNITSNNFVIESISSGDFADVEITDAAGCKQTLRVGPYTCLETSTGNCDTNAGAMLPVPFDVFCNLNAVVTLPIQYGYNTALAYGFLITDEALNIVDFSDDSKIDISNNRAGTYCIHGVSYEKNAITTPDFTAATLFDLQNQPNVCFDIILDDCIEIELQPERTNPSPPVGLKDTMFLCTGYTTPIDFCIPLTDADGGKPYLVDIISFCNPTIEGDNCVHYPPLPGLILGADETLSLIFCDDDCPQKCDTSYVNVSIREDCSGYEEPYLNDFFCGFDTINLCTSLSQPIDLCVECDQEREDYFIRDVRSRADGDLEANLSSNCYKYLPKNEAYNDIVEVDLCLIDEIVCVTKVFSIEVKQNCGNTVEPEECVEQQLCSLPTVLVEVCFDCEASKHPDAKITEIESLFDNCTTNEVRQMCFDYRPLPLMHLVGVDTVEVFYCTINDECFNTNVYLTFEDCDGLNAAIEEPVLVETNTTVQASDDHFNISTAEETTINVLANDIGENVAEGEVYVNIITAPQNGEISYNNTVNNISYTPNPNYNGDDFFVYEICNNGICDRAVAKINVDEQSNNFETNLTVAPNPAKDYLRINYKSTTNQKINIHLFNAAGKIVYNNETLAIDGQYQNSIDLSNLESGIYLIRLIEGRKISTEKIIVQ